MSTAVKSHDIEIRRNVRMSIAQFDVVAHLDHGEEQPKEIRVLGSFMSEQGARNKVNEILRKAERIIAERSK